MNFSGILVGGVAFLSIAVCHPLVIKCEYLFTRRCRWAFLLAGGLFALGSVFCGDVLLATMLGTIAFSLLWSAHELSLQERRVLRGRFPENPAHRDYYDSRRKALQVDKE